MTAERWWEHAACKRGAPRLFDLDTHAAPGRNARERALESAQPVIERYCHRCPVVADCLEDAVQRHDTGIRGGQLLTEEHGSVNAYNRHRQLGEDACAACLEAARAYGGDLRDPDRWAKVERSKTFV